MKLLFYLFAEWQGINGLSQGQRDPEGSVIAKRRRCALAERNGKCLGNARCQCRGVRRQQ